RLPALAAPHEVVPLRDEVPQRAALVAERDAAVHAATGLAAELRGVLLLVDLAGVHDADGNRAALRELALLHLEESLGVSHLSLPSLRGCATTPRRRRGRAPRRARPDGHGARPRS